MCVSVSKRLFNVIKEKATERNAENFCLNMTYIESVKETWLEAVVRQPKEYTYVKYLLVGVKSPKSNMNERVRLADKCVYERVFVCLVQKWQIDNDTYNNVYNETCKCAVVAVHL